MSAQVIVVDDEAAIREAVQQWLELSGFSVRTCASAAEALAAVDGKVPVPVKKAIVSALSRKDETADICLGSDGQPEPDKSLSDTENVPLALDTSLSASSVIHDYFIREVRPHVDEAWIAIDKTVIGYEISFNKYF